MSAVPALEAVQAHYRKKGIELDLYNPTYRYADFAFARTVPVEEVRQVLAGQPVQVIDTGYAIHLQSEGVSKGTAIVALARDMGLSPRGLFCHRRRGKRRTDARMGRSWRDYRKCPPGHKSGGIRRDG